MSSWKCSSQQYLCHRVLPVLFQACAAWWWEQSCSRSRSRGAGWRLVKRRRVSWYYTSDSSGGRSLPTRSSDWRSLRPRILSAPWWTQDRACHSKIAQVDRLFRNESVEANLSSWIAYPWIQTKVPTWMPQCSHNRRQLPYNFAKRIHLSNGGSGPALDAQHVKFVTPGRFLLTVSPSVFLRSMLKRSFVNCA